MKQTKCFKIMKLTRNCWWNRSNTALSTISN